MDDEQNPQPDPSTAATSTTEPTTGTERPASSRTRRWLAGATLVTVGLVAGSGATYAFTATSNDGGGTGSMAGYGAPAGGRGGPMGAPPGGAASTDGAQGSATDGQPS